MIQVLHHGGCTAIKGWNRKHQGLACFSVCKNMLIKSEARVFECGDGFSGGQRETRVWNESAGVRYVHEEKRQASPMKTAKPGSSKWLVPASYRGSSSTARVSSPPVEVSSSREKRTMRGLRTLFSSFSS